MNKITLSVQFINILYYRRVYAVIETTLHQTIYEQFKGGSKDYSLASTLSDQYQYLADCPPTPPLTQH